MSLSEQPHHVQLCYYEKVGKCTKGDLCKFAHHLGELREPGEQLLKSHQTRNFNKWSGGEILPNTYHILDSMSWAIWGTAQGCDPPDWILKLHWRCTNVSPGFEYLQEVADVVERFGPKKPPEPDDVEGAEPHTADDVEGGAKTEGLQPHEMWLSRKRMKSPSAAAPPKKKKRHHHGTSKERHCDEKRHHHGTSKERHRDGCGISKDVPGRQSHERWHSKKRKKSPSAAAPPQEKRRHHHDGTSKERHRDEKRHHHGTSKERHCDGCGISKASKEHRRDRDHCGISKEERRGCGHFVVTEEERAGRCIIRAKARPKSFLRSGHSPESFPKEDHPTRRRTRSNPQVRHHSQESYTSYSSSRSYYPGPK